MGFLFGGGGGSAPAPVKKEEPQKDIAGEQADAQAKQAAQLKAQEEQLSKDQAEAAKKATASLKARRGGGLRGLLSAERQDSELGIQSTKLGGGS